MSNFNIPDHVENEAAYASAVDRRIRENARKGKLKRWLAADETRAALVDVIAQRGYDRPGSFFGKMADSLSEWGQLTPGQEAACRKIIDEDAAKKAERVAAAAATSAWTGEVGKRVTLELTLVGLTSYDSAYGTVHVHIFETEAKACVIYKGGLLGLTTVEKVTVNRYVACPGVESQGRWDQHGYANVEVEQETFAALQKGQRVTLKATIKEHGLREGVKQTIVARPKVEGVREGEAT